MFRDTREMLPYFSEKRLDALIKDIDELYLKYSEPWKQTGFLLDESAWIQVRKPIADCVEKSGNFLDISCSNGYLLECILKWTGERGLSLIPYGTDLSEKLIALAKKRFPLNSNNFIVSRPAVWDSPVKFEYVRAELQHVLNDSQEQYLHRLFSSYIAEGGRLLLTEYRTPKQSSKEPWIDEKFKNWDFRIVKKVSGFYEGRELTRVIVLTRVGEN